MNKKYLLTIVLSFILTFQIVGIKPKNIVAEPINESVDSERMSGIWVSTTLNLDYPSKGTTNSSLLKSEADSIIENCEKMGITDIFFQVRPEADAFYKSDIYPWSQRLTGSQGLAPENNFDPLKYWIDEAHKRNIKLHAWINPYRITNTPNVSLESLAINNPARKNPSWVVSFEGKLYFDPAIKEVQNLVVSGIEEIIKNYDIDGIHLDDYFYPGANFDDSKSYNEFGNGQNKDDWRRANVDSLILALHNKISSLNKEIEFGISPAGIWANKKNNPLGSDTSGSEAYYKNYADTRKWALEEWIDYIAPQVYWEIGHNIADYKTIVDWWADTLANSKTKLYIGLADYKCDGVASQSPWYSGKAILEQINYNKQINKIDGEIHFRYKFVNNLSFLKNIVTNSNNVLSDSTSDAINDNPYNIKNNTKDIMVVVDGKVVEFDQKPVIENGRTLVPFRKIFEALGADVDWNNDTQQVKAKKDNIEISFIIGEKVLLINQKDTIMMEVAPKIIKSRSMVPIRVISEALECDVFWDNSNRLVTIKTK